MSRFVILPACVPSAVSEGQVADSQFSSRSLRYSFNALAPAREFASKWRRRQTGQIWIELDKICGEPTGNLRCSLWANPFAGFH